MTPLAWVGALVCLLSTPVVAQQPDDAGSELTQPATTTEDAADDAERADTPQERSLLEEKFGVATDGSVAVDEVGEVAPASERLEPVPLNLPETPGWLWGIGLLMVGGLAALRWQVGRGTTEGGRLRVVQRTVLGRDGHLAVVEVGEGDSARRLLVGYGSGAPRLVAELDLPDDPARAAASATPDPSAASGRRWRQVFARATGEGAEPEASPKLRPRTSLIAEVLAEREGEPVESDTAPVAPARQSSLAADEDDDLASETYTFRGSMR